MASLIPELRLVRLRTLSVRHPAIPGTVTAITSHIFLGNNLFLALLPTFFGSLTVGLFLANLASVTVGFAATAAVKIVLQPAAS